MNNFPARLFAAALLLIGVAQAQESAVPVASPAASPAPPTATGDPLDALTAAQIAEAISILRRDHVRGGQIDDAALARATLRGLLEDLSPGADFAAESDEAPPVSPFRSEILDGRAGYIRLGSLGSESVAQLDAALREFTEKKTHGVILDLRATPESADFPIAVQIASRFCPPGTILFTLSAPGGEDRKFVAEGEPLNRGILVVIIDADTSGAAEVLAATLRWNAKALLVGTRSSGRSVEFSDVAIADGPKLRLAVAEARVAGQPIYPRGLRPDIEIEQSPDVRDAVMSGSLEKGAAVFVFERERAQMDEAALVAGTNPELDSEPVETRLIDRPLQRAVDLVTALRVFRRPE